MLLRNQSNTTIYLFWLLVSIHYYLVVDCATEYDTLNFTHQRKLATFFHVSPLETNSKKKRKDSLDACNNSNKNQRFLVGRANPEP